VAFIDVSFIAKLFKAQKENDKIIKLMIYGLY
jgi:hypothetical protein